MVAMGALLGGNDDLGAGGEDGSSISISTEREERKLQFEIESNYFDRVALEHESACPQA
jgi:hypothetical protein